MKNILILHGSGSDSSGNWLPWLKEELEKREFKVWVPDLPNSDRPDVDRWKDYIFSNHDWNFNEESIIVGHSAGAAFILCLLQNLPLNIKINKAILVAGFVTLGSNKEVNEIKKGLLKHSFNWNKIKSWSNHFYFIHSDNDRYECDIKQGEIMQRKLGGELIFISGEDHFNLETSPKYKKFPYLLTLIQ